MAIPAAIDTQEASELLLLQDDCAENHGNNNIDGAVCEKTPQLLHSDDNCYSQSATGEIQAAATASSNGEVAAVEAARWRRLLGGGGCHEFSRGGSHGAKRQPVAAVELAVVEVEAAAVEAAATVVAV